MKYITKNYAKKHEQVQFIYSLLDLKAERGKIKRKSYETDEKINCKILRDLPKEIYNNLKDKESILSGYVCKEDNELLSTYAFYLLKDLEKERQRQTKLLKWQKKRCLSNLFLTTWWAKCFIAYMKTAKDIT